MNEAAREIASEAEEMGLRLRLHAHAVDSDEQLGIGADEPVVAASVFKIPVALEVARQAAAGQLDLDRRITIDPADLTPGSTGLATLRGPVTLSINDLAILMLSVSDNGATDLLLQLIDHGSLHDLLAGLGLTRTALPQNCAEIIRSIGDDLGLEYADAETALAGKDPAALQRLRALDPAQTCRTTARETSTLLRAIWRDEAAIATACAQVRHWMSHQAWQHRLASGFEDDVVVVGKTGTLPGVRNEAGVVTYPDGASYAVSVFLRDNDFRSRSSDRDSFIGWAARQAIEQLRLVHSPVPAHR